MNWMARMRAFVRDDAGQDLLEYALLVGLIAIVAYVAVEATGQSIFSIFGLIAGSLAGLT